MGIRRFTLSKQSKAMFSIVWQKIDRSSDKEGIWAGTSWDGSEPEWSDDTMGSCKPPRKQVDEGIKVLDVAATHRPCEHALKCNQIPTNRLRLDEPCAHGVIGRKVSFLRVVEGEWI